MKHTLGGPAIVLALVMAETAVGGLAVLWLSDAWGRTRMGFFKLIGGVLAVLAILAWLAARAPLLGVSCVSSRLSPCVGVPTAARAGVVLAVPIGVAALIAIAYDPAASSSSISAAFQLLAGALFAGAVTDGLLLGHWYLVERKLSRA